MPTQKIKKPKHLTAQSLTLTDEEGNARISHSAGKDSSSICLFSKAGPSIQISSQPNGSVVVALMGKGRHAILSLNTDGDSQLTLTDRNGKPGSRLGSVFTGGQHELIIFRDGQIHDLLPKPKKSRTKKPHHTNPI